MHAAGGRGIGSMIKELSRNGHGASVFAQLVGAVTAMHGIGYSHNDLHDQNVVILDQSTLVALIDFGETVPLARGKRSGGYKEDENVLARNAAKLARCPADAQYAFNTESISQAQHEARLQRLFPAVKCDEPAPDVTPTDS